MKFSYLYTRPSPRRGGSCYSVNGGSNRTDVISRVVFSTALYELVQLMNILGKPPGFGFPN